MRTWARERVGAWGYDRRVWMVVQGRADASGSAAKAVNISGLCRTGPRLFPFVKCSSLLTSCL